MTSNKHPILDDHQLFFVVGNGPSLQTKILDALPEGRWVGMNAAYKYWDKSGRYPHYYSCLDPVVVVQHADAIQRMIDEGKIAEFFLHEEILKVLPGLKDHPKVTLRDAFMAQAGTVPISPLSQYKQTTGVLATRFCIEAGHRNLCLLGIDCNYVEQLSEAQAGKGYELIIKSNMRRNPNYFFGNYQEKNEKYQVPNPGIHSGNLHLQSFIALREDVANSDFSAEISVGSRDSLLSKFNIFPYFDVATALEKRRVDAIAVPLVPHELDGFLERLNYWIDPKLQPSFAPVSEVALHLFLSCGERSGLQEKIEAAAQSLPWLSRYFSELRVTFLDISPEVDYYIKGTSLNVFCNKSGPNIFFLMIMAACRDYQNTFLMEADCVPVRPGWLDALEQATTDCPPGTWVIGANYSGPTMTSGNNAFHINGNAIYATGDHGFQDFLNGDFQKTLEWLITRVSNNIAYDVAYAQGIIKYVDILRDTGIDLRHYIRRFVHSPVILNLSGTEELKPELKLDVMAAIQIDKDVYLAHGRPFLSALGPDLQGFDSFFAEDMAVVCEMRPHSFASVPVTCDWVFKGFGTLEGQLRKEQAPDGKISLQFRVGVADVWGKGRIVLRLTPDPMLELCQVSVSGRRPGRAPVDIPVNKVVSGSRVGLSVTHEGLSAENVSELIVRLEMVAAENTETIHVGGLRILFLPTMLHDLTFRLCKPSEEPREVETRWMAWREKGQKKLSAKFSFLQEGAGSPILKALNVSPKAEFNSGKLDIALVGGSYAEFHLDTNRRSAKCIALRLNATQDCMLLVSVRGPDHSEYRKEFCVRTGQDSLVQIDTEIGEREPIIMTVKEISDAPNPGAAQGKLTIVSIDLAEADDSSARRTRILEQNSNYTRVISVNPDAESFFGHFLNYEARLGRALTARSLAHIIAGPVDAGADVYAAHPEMVRVFTGRTNTLYAKRPGEAVPGLGVFETELDKYLASLKHDDSTLLFMYCGSLEIAEIFERMADKYPSCTFAISLYYLSWLDLKAVDFVAHWRPRIQALAAHPGIRLIVPSPELSEELQKGFNVTPEVLPHPTTTFHDEEIGAQRSGRMSESDKRLTVVFPGNLRGGKGYDIMAEAIRSLLATEGNKVRIRVRFPPDDSVNKARRAFFDSIRDRVEIMDSYLDETAFRNLLLSADLVALPYTADRFGNRTSGLLVDSLLLGIPCVVIEKTWLARTVSEYGFGLASAERGSALAVSIRKALGRIVTFKAAAIAGRDRYMQGNSWDALVGFLVSRSQVTASVVGTKPARAPVTLAAFASLPDTTTTKDTAVPKRLLIIGNGPSARILAEAGLHNIPADMDSFGTTAAFRHFEQIGWWPTYYALADRKVVFHHREKFARLLKDPKVTTKRFFLSWQVSESERLELIPHSSTGSFSLKKAVELGYKEIYLIGMEGAYVEEILESRPLTEKEIAERGFGVLNLSRAESKLLIIDRTPAHNPNYFFSGYQQKGDVYSLPQAHTHQANWDTVKTVVKEAGARVINLSRISKIDAFERGDIQELFDFLPSDCWDDIADPFSEKAQHVKSHYTFTAGTTFAKRSGTEWHYAPGRGQPSALRAIFEHVGVTEGRTLVGGLQLTASRPAKIVITLGRDGRTEYEGTGQTITLKAGVPVTVDLFVAFRKQHKKIKLQISDIELQGAKDVDLRVETVYLTEAVHSVVRRHTADELTVARADRAFRAGEDSFALATYLHLEDLAAPGSYHDKITKIARRIGLSEPENSAQLEIRLMAPKASTSAVATGQGKTPPPKASLKETPAIISCRGMADHGAGFNYFQTGTGIGEPVAFSSPEDLAAGLGEDASGLIIYNDPIPVLAEVLAKKGDPAAALVNWEEQAAAALAVLRKARRQLSLVERGHLMTAPAAYRVMLEGLLPGQRLPGMLHQEIVPLDPLLHMIASLYLQQRPTAQRHLAELRASGLRPEGVSPQKATNLPAVLATYHALTDGTAGLEKELDSLRAGAERVQGDLGRAQTQKQTLGHEVTLLNEQLTQLQATVETYFKETEALRAELDRIYRSKSWRVTEPLRGMRRAAQLALPPKEH